MQLQIMWHPLLVAATPSSHLKSYFQCTKALRPTVSTPSMQDVAKKEAEPLPAASPEDLAAIAALEAGDDLVLQPPRTCHQPASPYLLTGRPPPPPPPLSLPATYTPQRRGHSTSDQLWKVSVGLVLAFSSSNCTGSVSCVGSIQSLHPTNYQQPACVSILL